MLKMQSPWSLVRTTRSESLGAGVETMRFLEAFQESLLYTGVGITAAFCLDLRVPDS